MTINWIQAAILGLFACLCSNSCMAGQVVGNYMIGRPLAGGLVCGIILGDLKLGTTCGVAMQLVYIALVIPGGTVSADVRAISYIGIPLAMVAISTKGLDSLGGSAADLAESVGTLIGTIGTVLFYFVAALDLVWQSFGWKDIKKGKLDHLYAINSGWPWISHLFFSFLSTVILTYSGATAVATMRDALPVDGLAMETLFTVGGMLPCVGIAILLRRIVNKNTDFIPFFVRFALAASLRLDLVSITITALLFAVIFYRIALIKDNTKLVNSTGSLTNDDEEEDIWDGRVESR